MEINHEFKTITINKKFETLTVSDFNQKHDFKIIIELIKKGYEVMYI